MTLFDQIATKCIGIIYFQPQLNTSNISKIGGGKINILITWNLTY